MNNSITKFLKTVKKLTFHPYRSQKEGVALGIQHFKEYDIGQLAKFCRTGKTMTSILIALGITKIIKNRKILTVTHSLTLTAQTLYEYNTYLTEEFEYLIVCSKDEIGNVQVEDDGNIIRDGGYLVTTNVSDIAAFLKSNKQGIVISTYHSLDKVDTALKQSGTFFDFAVIDEAQHTAGDADKFFATVTSPKFRAKKRLYQTGTPRIIISHEKGIIHINSMDMEDIYGKVFYRYNYSQARKDGIVADFQILMPVISPKDDELVREISKGKTTVNIKHGNEIVILPVNIAALYIAIYRCMMEHGIHKLLAFHNRIEDSAQFITAMEGIVANSVVFAKHEHKEPIGLYARHVYDKTPIRDRIETNRGFEKSKYGIISNVAVYSIGVTLPELDAVVFCAPKSSTEQIVQYASRCLGMTKKEKGKVGYIIMPFVANESETEDKYSNRHGYDCDRMLTVFELLYALDADMCSRVKAIKNRCYKVIGRRKAIYAKMKRLEKLLKEATEKIKTMKGKKSTAVTKLEKELDAKRKKLSQSDADIEAYNEALMKAIEDKVFIDVFKGHAPSKKWADMDKSKVEFRKLFKRVIVGRLKLDALDRCKKMQLDIEDMMAFCRANRKVLRIRSA